MSRSALSTMRHAVCRIVFAALLLLPVLVRAVEDTRPPARFDMRPHGGLFGGERNVELSLKTDEWAECRFGSVGGETFDALTERFATTSGATAHRAVVKSLNLGVGYMYAVRCRDSVGNVNTDDVYIMFSVTAPVEDGDFTKPAPPPDFRARVVSETEIDLTWAASFDNDTLSRYRLYRCSGGQCTPVASMAAPTTTIYRDTGLTPRTHYRYQVTAIDKRSNESLRSRIAAATTTLGATDEAPPALVAQSAETASGALKEATVATPSTSRSRLDRVGLIERQIRALIRQLARLLAQYTTLLQNR